MLQAGGEDGRGCQSFNASERKLSVISGWLNLYVLGRHHSEPNHRVNGQSDVQVNPGIYNGRLINRSHLRLWVINGRVGNIPESAADERTDWQNKCNG